MKKTFTASTLILALIIFSASVSQAQFKKNEMKRSDYTGNIIKKEDPSAGANLGNLFNMEMNHSYSVSFGSMGGQVMNMNAYTNSMSFFFNEDLTGQVNVSLLHSPFGQSNFYDFQNQDALNVALNAQLDYQINDRMHIRFEVTKLPDGYGYYNRNRNSLFRNGPLY